MPFSRETLGAFHLLKISGISGSAVNGTRFVGSSHWKILRKGGKSRKVVPFSRLEFPNGMSCSIYVSRSLYQFQVHSRAPLRIRGLRPNGTTFYQSEIPLLLPPKFPGFFPKWKAPPGLSPPQRPLCIVGRLLCCGEAGEKEKESARGPLPIVPRALSIIVDY